MCLLFPICSARVFFVYLHSCVMCVSRLRALLSHVCTARACELRAVGLRSRRVSTEDCATVVRCVCVALHTLEARPSRGVTLSIGEIGGIRPLCETGASLSLSRRDVRVDLYLLQLYRDTSLTPLIKCARSGTRTITGSTYCTVGDCGS